MDNLYSEDFIRVYDNAVSNDFCKNLISYFEWSKNNHRSWDRTSENASNLLKKDSATLLEPIVSDDIGFNNDSISSSFISEFNNSFWNNCYAKYVNEFNNLNEIGRHTIFHHKIQKTLPREGYHTWHAEHNGENRSRISVFILYLNDIFDGGETEFLYQSKRVSPRTGRLVIWPAAYTHVHRGNPPLKDIKYIMTGWTEFN